MVWGSALGWATGLIVWGSLLLCHSCSTGLSTAEPLGLAPRQQFRTQNRQLSRDPVALIKEANALLERRDPEVVAQKYRKMAEDPYSFFRGSAAIFYRDIQSDPELQTPVHLMLQGDLHLENMSTYRAADGQFAYDLNDFDEAFTGPYLWDIGRCSVSIHLAAEAGGLALSQRQQLVRGFLDTYLYQLPRLQAPTGELNKPLTLVTSQQATKALFRARVRKHAEWLAEVAPGSRFKPSKKIQPVPEALQAPLTRAIRSYAAQRPEMPAFFTVKDLARRTAGTASLGRYRYIALIEGRTVAPTDDRILELKEAAPPSANISNGEHKQNQASRIVNAYHYFLPLPDPFLASVPFQGLDFYISEWLPEEEVDLDKLESAAEFREYLETVALILARAQARALKTGAIIKEAGQPEWKVRIERFAQEYAGQVQQDYRLFKQAIE